MNTTVEEIPWRCVILGFGGIAKPVAYILSTRYPMREYLLVDRRRIKDEEIEVFGNKNVSLFEKDIKPSELYDIKCYLIKDNEVVIDFYGCNETMDIFNVCNKKKGIVYANASMEEDITDPIAYYVPVYITLHSFYEKFKP